MNIETHEGWALSFSTTNARALELNAKLRPLLNLQSVSARRYEIQHILVPKKLELLAYFSLYVVVRGMLCLEVLFKAIDLIKQKIPLSDSLYTCQDIK